MTSPDSEETKDTSTSDTASSADLFDPDKVFRQHLTRGFTFLSTHVRERLLANDDVDLRQLPGDPEDTPDFLTRVEVNVVDPTSVKTTATETAKQPLDLYQKLQSLFVDHSHSILQNVPFQNFRSGEAATIESLKVSLVTTHTIGGTMLSIPKTLPQDWHNDPYAHAYIAACDSLEHYRTTVKPSIQAVVSQLDAAQYKGRYLIVFCPTTTSEDTAAAATNSSSSSTYVPGQRVRAFASRVAAARQRMRSSTPDAAETSSQDGDDVAEDTNNATTNTTTANETSGFSKSDKEILRRLRVDFPTARVCPLSLTLLLEHGNEEVRESEWFQTEWNTFLEELGAVIVDGFRFRCKRYDDELKRLIAKQNEVNGVVLVKESFAFTYEQMRQHSEALLQYEELRAILPDVTSKNLSFPKKSSVSVKDGRSLMEVALAGDAVAFREFLATIKNLADICEGIEYYLLARETHELFEMLNPIGVIRRCLSCVQKMHKLKLTQALQSNDEDAVPAVNRWAFEFCWDVKLACSIFSSSGVQEGARGLEDFARIVCDLVNFARFRLSDLGSTHFSDIKPPKIGSHEAAFELLQSEWDPWEEPTNSSDELTDDLASIPQNAVIPYALSSVDAFQTVHANLTRVLATSMESCGRKRYAACLRLEIIDIAVRRKQFDVAEKEFDAIAKSYLLEKWSVCNFYTLFQLAKLQRKSSSPQKYLRTLIRCFTNSNSPSKAVDTLFDDLSKVVRSKSLSGVSISAAPIFQPILGLEDFKMIDVTLSDRNLFKKVYAVGETVSVTISLTNRLPEKISASSLSVALVPFQKYVAAMEDSVDLPEEDVTRKLFLRNLTIVPGPNQFTLEWAPLSSGQVVLASAEIQWECCTFTYTVKEMQRPTVRVDVIPCEPTQTFRMNPGFLIPGHVQPVDLIFQSEKDIVSSGAIQLVGSPGVQVCASEEDRENSSLWRPTLEVNLSKCAAGSTTSTRVFVKCEGDQEDGWAGFLQAKLTSTFRPTQKEQPHLSEAYIDDSDSLSHCSLEARIAAIGRPAFDVDAVEVVPYTADGLIVNISLNCNTPDPFSLQNWSLELPPSFHLREGGNLNDTLAGSLVSFGEKVSLAFDCTVSEELPATSDGILSITFSDTGGTSFSEKTQLKLFRPEYRPRPRAKTELIPVSISTSSENGLVGEPLDLTCRIDLSKVPRAKDVHYAVHASSEAVLLHGKTEGVIRLDTNDSGECILEYVAVPLRPGSISLFVIVSLNTIDDEGCLSELPVEIKQCCNTYSALDVTKQTTVAFPV